METPGPTGGIVERARALVPLLRGNALTTERERRVAPENIEAMAEAGIFRITTPRRFGGYESSLVTQVDVLREIGRGCGSSSWVAAVYSVGTWLVGLFTDELQEEVFATADVRVNTVGTPSAIATPAGSDYRVRGRWAFATGCLDAHWAVLGAQLEAGSDEPAILWVAVPYSELEIEDDWYVSGLRGTGSRSLVGADLLVPEHRVLWRSEADAGQYRSELNAGQPLFRAALAPFIVANSAGTPLGLGEAALEAFLERLPGRGITFTSYSDQRAAPVTHLQVGEAAIRLESAQYHARRSAELVDERAAQGVPLSLEERARVRMDLAWVTELARSAVRILQEGSGATSIHDDVPIQRISRDIEALALHGILNPKTNYELYGRVLCGLDLDGWVAV